MTKRILIGLISLLSFTSYSQSFEGYITYITDELNPNSKSISDSLYQDLMSKQSEEKKVFQKDFYKKGNFFSEITTGQKRSFRVYNPKDGLLYSWKERSDTVVTITKEKHTPELIEIIESEEVDTVLGIICKSIIVKSKLMQTTYWYNSEYLKMDANHHEGDNYDDHLIKKIGCLPLKIERENFFFYHVQTAVEFKETSVEDKKFDIPEFKEMIELKW